MKVEQYLRFGAKQVWIIYPKRKRIHVYRPGVALVILDQTQMLEGGELLPGFEVKVADLFIF